MNSAGSPRSNPREINKVAVAMSGGVDSSVAAALLLQQGYEVIGLMQILWSDPGNQRENPYSTPAALQLARQAAEQLEMPFQVIETSELFYDVVVQYFLKGYAQGITPNPCLLCNRIMRWGSLLGQALSLGADHLATGHYARLEKQPGKPVRLLKGIDPQKDQSYVLSQLSQQQLQHTLLPLGGYTKSQVRQLAAEYQLPSAQIKDSQDLCFLAGTDQVSFLERYLPRADQTGPIQTRSGEVLGRHNGLAFYTIGQRKGIGVSSRAALYVLDKDIDNNTLIVGGEDELGGDTLQAGSVNWISGVVPDINFPAQVKIRYTSAYADGLVSPQGADAFSIEFKQPLRDITPGQAAVVYIGEEVIASGIIEDTPSASRQKTTKKPIERAT